MDCRNGSWTLALASLALLATGGPARAGVSRDGGGAVFPVLGDLDGSCVVDIVDVAAIKALIGSDDPRGDLNEDGEVDRADLDLLLAVFGSTCGRRLVGDVDGDGLVTVVDLNALLGAFGSATPRADLDGDGTVGAIDEALLLANWGRSLSIWAVPVPVGSNQLSPLGTSMGAGSGGSVPSVRSMSWSTNWPHCHRKSVAPRSLGRESVCQLTALLTARGLGRPTPAIDAAPSA